MSSSILGIETSCDETAVAVLEVLNDNEVLLLADEVSSQIKIHKEYGGVVPELAAREHLKNLPLIYENALTRAGKTLDDIDLIAVTQGPGLKGCLLMGFCFAQGLSLAKGIPLLGVHHIEGHMFSPFIKTGLDIQFPFLSLTVSGGHTELVLVKELGKYEVVARTIDDAAGEAFDKSANLLGFEYPGGAELAGLADSISESHYELPKVMREARGFSFSGLKTAISLLINKNEALLNDAKERTKICYTIQDSIVDALIYKTKLALEETGVKNLVLAGGVAANKYLRNKLEELADSKGIELHVPEIRHCMDNAAMIAFVGALRRNQVIEEKTVYPRWQVEKI